MGSNTPLSLEEVGAKLDLSRERVRQLEERAIKRLKSIAVRIKIIDPRDAKYVLLDSRQAERDRRRALRDRRSGLRDRRVGLPDRRKIKIERRKGPRERRKARRERRSKKDRRLEKLRLRLLSRQAIKRKLFGTKMKRMKRKG